MTSRCLLILLSGCLWLSAQQATEPQAFLRHRPDRVHCPATGDVGAPFYVGVFPDQEVVFPPAANTPTKRAAEIKATLFAGKTTVLRTKVAWCDAFEAPFTLEVDPTDQDELIKNYDKLTVVVTRYPTDNRGTASFLSAVSLELQARNFQVTRPYSESCASGMYIAVGAQDWKTQEELTPYQKARLKELLEKISARRFLGRIQYEGETTANEQNFQVGAKGLETVAIEATRCVTFEPSVKNKNLKFELDFGTDLDPELTKPLTGKLKPNKIDAAPFKLAGGDIGKRPMERNSSVRLTPWLLCVTGAVSPL